jgi:hypothetical protein
MPVSVPTDAEFQGAVDAVASHIAELQGQMDNLSARVTALEQAEPVPPVDPEPGMGLTVELSLDGQSYPFAESDAVDIGSYADPAGRFTMTCRRIECGPTLPDFRIDFRRVPGWCCVVFERSNGLLASEPTNWGAHTVQILDGQRLEEIALPAHYWAARWRWQSGPWPFPIADVDELVERGLLPRLDANVNRGTARPLPVPTYTPMGLAGLMSDMGSTGGRADIGVVTDWQAEWICGRHPDMLAGILAQGEAGGTIPWMFRDPNTGAPLDLMNTWRQASCYWASSTNPYVYPAKDTGIKIDTAHMPAVAFVPFAITGDPYFLETLQAQANMAFLQDPRSWENVWQMPGSGQTRSMAWNLRSIMQAAAVTPDEVPSWLLAKSVMQQMLGQCVKGTDVIMNEPRTLRTELHCVDVGLPGQDTATAGGWYPGGTYSHPWQHSFFCQAAAWGASLHPELRPLAGYVAKNLIARTKGEVWDASYPAEYCLLLRTQRDTETWFADWPACWAANAPLLMTPVSPLKNQMTQFTDYHGGVYAGLCALMHARDAGVMEIPEEIDAVLERYAGQMDALLAAGGSNYLTHNNSYAR